MRRLVGVGTLLPPSAMGTERFPKWGNSRACWTPAPGIEAIDSGLQIRPLCREYAVAGFEPTTGSSGVSKLSDRNPTKPKGNRHDFSEL